MAIDWPSVSERIRGLVHFHNDDDVAETAARLDVPEQQLKDAMNDKSRRATVDVVAAVVSLYGLDPTWVLTGTYDAATHRMALESDRTLIQAAVKRLVAALGGGQQLDAPKGLSPKP